MTSGFLNYCGALLNDGFLSETNTGDKMETIMFFLNSFADGVLNSGGLVSCGEGLGFCLWCFCWVCWFLPSNHPLCNDKMF